MLASVLALLLVASFAVNSMVDDGQSASGDEPSPPAAAAVPGASETASTDGVPVGDAPPTLEDAPPPSDQPSTTSTEPGDGTDDGVLPSTDIDVPSDWVEYTPDDAPYRLRHPPGWNVVQVSDTLTDIRDPQSATYLRLDWVAETRDPVGAWENLEPSFAARHSDYENLGITPTTFKGDRAALWEYRYRSGGRSLHAYNLGVNAGDYGFALNLQTTQDDWTDAQELWAQLLSSYEFTGP